ncbi:hypothetical protein ACS0TY_009011 [Phlomoides rotata]
MHAYFDEFVHSRSTLKQFMEQYDMAMGNNIQKEFIADFQSKNKNIQTVNETHMLRMWRKDVNRRHSNIFFAGGYPHMMEEYKKFQEVEKYFQQCIELAMCSSERLEFIKERCNEMEDVLVNWVPTTSDNVPPSQTTENTEVGGGTPILNPVVTTTRGRPKSSRYISRAEECSRAVEVVVDECVVWVLVEAEFKVELVGVAETNMVMEWVLKEMKEEEMLHKKMKKHSYLT